MGRPAKAVGVKAGAISKADEMARRVVEERIKGDEVPVPPEWLTQEQREIFQFIVDGLESAGILGRLDVFVLESVSVAVDRIRSINRQMDEEPKLVGSAALQNARSKYMSDLWRGCNELCLSPQARAKIGNMAAAVQKEKKDPLLEVLMMDE